MGYTKRQLIDAALEEIGLDPVNFDVDGAEQQKCARRLEALIAKWDAENIPLGYALSDEPEDINIDAESGLRNWAYEAVYLNLAVSIAPTFGKQIMPDTKKAAHQAKIATRAKTYIITQRQYPNTMPVGSGNRRGNSRRNYYIETTYLSEIEDN